MRPILSLVFLAAVLAVSSVFIVSQSNDSDAVSAGLMDIYIYDGSSWEEYPDMMGYNALQALQSTGLDIVADTDYIVDGAINSNYGNVSAIGDDAETDSRVWSTVYFHDGAWVVGPDAIGFITPFLDRWHNSANVVLYYGWNKLTDVPSDVYTYFSGKTLADLIEPYTDDYAYDFYLKVEASGCTPTIAEGTEVLWFNEDILDFEYVPLTSQMLTDGVDIRGYGSNAYAALRDAVGGDNIDGGYSSFSSFSLFGLSFVDYSSTFDYLWVQSSSSGGVLEFPLGAYSTLHNVPRDTGYTFVESSFNLTYTVHQEPLEVQLYPDFNGLFGSSSGFPTFILSIDANGGSGSASLTYQGDRSSHEFTIPSTEPTMSGHAFTGWNTEADGSGSTYSAGQTVSVPAYSTVTLYAQWEAAEADISFESYPTQDCVTAPTVVYREDGSYSVEAST